MSIWDFTGRLISAGRDYTYVHAACMHVCIYLPRPSKYYKIGETTKSTDNRHQFLNMLKVDIRHHT